MKRLIAGTTLAAGLSMGVSQAEAVSSPPEICSDVYDQVGVGDSSGQLRAAISRFALQDIEVHVQILNDGRSEGISAPSDTEKFTSRIERECGLEAKNLLDIVISDNPRAFDVYFTGKAEQEISDDFNQYRNDFISDLKDQSTSYQSDAAELLEALYSKEQSNNQPFIPEDSSVTEKTGSVPQERGSFPFVLVLEGLGVAALLGGVGTRTVRGFALRNTKSEALSAIDQARGVLTSTMFQADEQLTALHENDGLELRSLSQSALDAANQAGERQNAFLGAYKSQQRSLWPNKQLVMDESRQISDVASTLTLQEAKLRAELDQIGSYIAHIDEMSVQHTEAVLKVHATAKAIEQSGWNIGTYAEELKELDQFVNQVKALREDKLIEKPGDIITGQLLLAADLEYRIKSLPQRRVIADKEFSTHAGVIADKNALADKTTAALEALRQTYDQSCFADVDTVDTTLKAQLKKLEEIQKDAKEVIIVTNLKSLEKSESLNREFTSVSQNIDATVLRVTGRTELLDKIKRELPDRLKAVDRQLEDAKAFAFEQYEADVEPTTRRAITEAINAFKSFENTTEIAKPAYLKIVDEVDDYGTMAAAVMAAAHAEKREMDDLRSQVDSLEDQTTSAISDLESYVNNHRSDIGTVVESTITTLTAFVGDTSASRSNLRSQVSDGRECLRAISEIENRARHDVQREEERRRRERQEAEDRRRAAAAAASSHSSGSFGGSSGGGSHNSGSF